MSGYRTAAITQLVSAFLELLKGFCCLIPRGNGNSRAGGCSSGGLGLVDAMFPLPNTFTTRAIGIQAALKAGISLQSRSVALSKWGN